MDALPVGELCALGAALCWAVALILFKLSGKSMSPMPLSLFKNIVALILLAITLVVMQDGPGALRGFQRIDIIILLLSGTLGIALADTVFFYALDLIGVGMVSIVDCLYSPFIILFSALMLQEELTVFDYVGTALILFAVLMTARLKPPQNRTRAQITGGVLLGALAMASMTFGIVLAKPVLDLDFPLIWATILRLIAGTIALALIMAVSRNRKAYFSALRPAPVWWYCVPASALGSYLALILWIAGFKYAHASTAGILNQTSTIFAIILATLVLKESFTSRKLAAVTLAVAGVVLVTGKDLWLDLWRQMTSTEMATTQLSFSHWADLCGRLLT